ncbi:MAG: DUF433 domain-containing protein [Thermodesulfobacteriota bacterium]|nr:DUF433 domain-containing protein [Thermodesulfobacteriota bacterium]
MLNTENLLSRITFNPKIMLGKPTIRGMRITVEQILRALSGGVSEQELLEEYPDQNLRKRIFRRCSHMQHGWSKRSRCFPSECPHEFIQTEIHS